MHIMEILRQILYTVSTALLIPVIVGLLFLMTWVIMEVGGFIHEFVARRRSQSLWQSFIEKLQAESNPPERSTVMRFFLNTHYPGFLSVFAERGRDFADSSVHLGRLVATLEVDANSRLSRMNLGVRVGPILGLMGTLIPLGPALIGLASGNIQELAKNLVVAFSTTVLGLFVGGMCYAMSLVRRKWYAQDLADIEYLYQCLFGTERRNHNVQKPNA